jgi:hypothetical protein
LETCTASEAVARGHAADAAYGAADAHAAKAAANAAWVATCAADYVATHQGDVGQIHS